MNKIELLAPAGDLEKLKIAILYGADAVYIGGKKFSLRARASNFDIVEIKEAVEFAHKHEAKIFITLNIIPHDEDINGLIEYVADLVKCNIDAVICADLFVLTTIKRHFPNLEVHISTQQSVANHKSINTFMRFGASRVVLARELLLANIKQIANSTNAELEVFVHGGMCMSYSGRCVLSNYMTDRDANRGGCSHSCRWNYKLLDENKAIFKSDTPFSLASKDLIGIKHIPTLIDYGVTSVKIEGRMKSLHYVATVVNAYRRAIDYYYEFKKEIPNEIILELKNAENRLAAEGFLGGFPTKDEQLYNMRSEMPTQAFIGIVRDYDEENKMLIIEQRNHFKIGDNIEIFSPTGEKISFVLKKMYNLKDENLLVGRHPKEIIKIPFDRYVNQYSLLRKI